MQEMAEEYRTELVEAAAEANEEPMDKYWKKAELTEAEIKQGLRTVPLTMKSYFATCGSAFKNKGVQAVLDAVVGFPSFQSMYLQLKVSMMTRMKLSVTRTTKNRSRR